MSLKFVKQSVSTVVDGKRVRLTKDDPWRDDDPIVVAAPQFFVDEPSKVHSSLPKFSAPVVEQATAAPGSSLCSCGRCSCASPRWWPAAQKMAPRPAWPSRPTWWRE